MVSYWKNFWKNNIEIGPWSDIRKRIYWRNQSVEKILNQYLVILKDFFAINQVCWNNLFEFPRISHIQIR